MGILRTAYMGLCSSKHTNCDYCTCKRCDQQRAVQRAADSSSSELRSYQQRIHYLCPKPLVPRSQPVEPPKQPELSQQGHDALRVFLELHTNQMPMWETLNWRVVHRDFCTAICESATRISLRDCRADEAAGFAGLQAMRKLRSISLRDSPLVTDDFVARCLADRPCLTALDLSFCPQLTQLDVNLPELTSLKVAGTSITDEAICRLLSNCPKLRHLDVTQCNLTGISFKALASLCPMLQSLVAANCPQLTSEGLTSLAHCSTLTELNVAGNRLNDGALLNTLQHNKSLRALNVTGCTKLTDLFLEPLGWLEGSQMTVCPGLVNLNLSDCSRLTDDTIRKLSEERPHLRLLGIRARRILNSPSRAAHRLSADNADMQMAPSPLVRVRLQSNSF